MQFIEQDDDFLPRVSFESHRSSCAYPFSPFLIIDGLSRKSFSYNKLPQEAIKLTVIKLDGSTFDVEVAKMATVAELKQAVEGVFSHLPKKGPGKVSWLHVWGHFCLCYGGQKLVTDDEHIIDYGIKDSDQLHFIRHVSVNYNLIKKRSNDRDSDLELPRIEGGSEDRDQNCEKDDGHNDQVDLKDQEREDEDDDEDVVTRGELKISQLLGGWFSYRRLSSPQRRFDSICFPSTFTDGFPGNFRNIVRYYSNKSNSRRGAWKQV